MHEIDSRATLRVTSHLAEPRPDGASWRQHLPAGHDGEALVVTAGHAAVFERVPVQPGDQLLLRFGPALPAISDDGLVATIQLDDGAPLLTRHLLSGAAWEEVRLPIGRRGPVTLTIRCDAGPRGDPRADWLAVTGICIAPAASPPRARRGRSAFAHALEGVRATCLLDPIHFAGRAADRSRHVPMDLLVVGADGLATVDALLARTANPARVTLIDDDEGLARVTPDAGSRSLTTLRAAPDEAEPPRDAFDVAVCVSRFHRLVEQERVAARLADSLRPGGELWVIGEYVGRSGGRLWPESQEAADALFATLPPRCRVNRVAPTGPDGIDRALRPGHAPPQGGPGSRCGEIEGALSERFETLHVDRWSTIAWRILGPAYNDNYDMGDPGDVALVERIAAADADHLMSGRLRPVALSGVFRPL